MSLKRKIQKAKKKKAEKDLKDKVMSFDRMPDCCVVCFKDFDKKSREMAMSWYVVERREQKRVSLFCPDCWKDGLSAAKEFVIKKETELDKYMKGKEDSLARRKKVAPSPKDYPEVQDYVKKGNPKITKVPRKKKESGTTSDEGAKDE